MQKPVYEYLIEKGFRAENIGFQYLGYGIELYMSDDYYHNKKSGLFQKIADTYHTSVGAVKRAVRYAISNSEVKGSKPLSVIADAKWSLSRI